MWQSRIENADQNEVKVEKMGIEDDGQMRA